MADASTSFHEAVDELHPETRDRHRAIVSLMEELEAVDWYDQRIDAARDGELKDILAHNRDEEKEHATMMLEWLRRRDASLDENLRRYLFTTDPIMAIEEAAEEGEAAAEAGASNSAGDGSLGIGSLKGENHS